MNIKRKHEVVIKAPLLDGDNMPSMATTATNSKEMMFIHRTLPSQRQTWSSHRYSANSQMTMRTMQKSCVPEPSRELRIIGYWGGLKTSPWTFFHPDSSMVSSCLNEKSVWSIMLILKKKVVKCNVKY